MTVDYRLLPKWEASQHRHAQTRRALPASWQNDVGSVAQVANESWVRLHVLPKERDGARTETAAALVVRLPLDDR